jgi:hypothetical protein
MKTSILAVSAAHFVVCQKCGRHGKIVTASGEEFDAIAVNHAIRVVHDLVAVGKIWNDEVPELERQIRESRIQSFLDPAELPATLLRVSIIPSGGEDYSCSQDSRGHTLQ